MEGLAFLIRLEISSTEGNRKEEKVSAGGEGSADVLGRGTELRAWWIFSTLSLKNDMMVLQKEVVYRWVGRESGGLVVVLTMENKDFVFPSLAEIRLEKYFVFVILMESL